MVLQRHLILFFCSITSIIISQLKTLNSQYFTKLVCFLAFQPIPHLDKHKNLIAPFKPVFLNNFILNFKISETLELKSPKQLWSPYIFFLHKHICNIYNVSLCCKKIILNMFFKQCVSWDYDLVYPTMIK